MRSNIRSWENILSRNPPQLWALFEIQDPYYPKRCQFGEELKEIYVFVAFYKVHYASILFLVSIHSNSSNIYKGLLNKVLFLLKSTVFLKLFQSNFARTHKKIKKVQKCNCTWRQRFKTEKLCHKSFIGASPPSRNTVFQKNELSKLGQREAASLRKFQFWELFWKNVNFFEHRSTKCLLGRLLKNWKNSDFLEFGHQIQIFWFWATDP